MEKFLTWLAVSPLSSAARNGLGAALAYVLANIDSFGLNPVVAIAIGAALPTLIRALNPKDGIFGAGASEIVEE